ncbi:hypothetical protein JYU34_002565 [Plutella xylostella]|uniref:Secreted protein n=1 Tax=Plutella xylostella TaxID=51655 RepID=A0ABQ7R2Q4_PLUXY|nr:hypothetical protein JYU34_002565 [Plutella xylostella]
MTQRQCVPKMAATAVTARAAAAACSTSTCCPLTVIPQELKIQTKATRRIKRDHCSVQARPPSSG